MKDYFYGENAADFEESEMLPESPRLRAILGVLAILALLGCAATRETEICYMKAIGETEDNNFTVVLQQCMTTEAFKESQK